MAKRESAFDDLKDVAAKLPWWLSALHLKGVIDNAKGMPAFTIVNWVTKNNAGGQVAEYS